MVDAYLYNPPRKGSEVQTNDAKNPYQYSSDAVTWVNSNSDEYSNAIAMLSNWSYGDAILATTTINGGLIQANTILADAIAVDQLSAITANIGEVTAGLLKSADYAYTSGVYSDAGIMLSLTDKIFRAMNFAIDANGNAYFKGNVTANNVTIKDANGNNLASYGAGVKFYLPGTTTVATEFTNDGLVMSRGSININDRFIVNKDGGVTISYSSSDPANISDILTVQKVDGSNITKYIYLDDDGNLVINGSSIRMQSGNLLSNELPGINLSPFFSHDITDKYDASSNPTGYWSNFTVPSQYTYTQLSDGWVHVKIDNSSGSSTVRNDICCIANDAIIASADYTFLFEFKNRVSTASGSGDCYVVQGDNGCQFWGSTIKKNLEGIGTTSSTTLNTIPTDGTIYKKRFVKTSEAEDSTRRTANPKHMVCIVFRATAGEVIEFDFRASIYKDEYLGPYQPYILSDDANARKLAQAAQTTANTAVNNYTTLSQTVTSQGTQITQNK